MLEKILKRKPIKEIIGDTNLTQEELDYITKLLENDYAFTQIKNIFKMVVNKIPLHNISTNIDKIKILGKNTSSLTYLELFYPKGEALIKMEDFKNKSKHTLEKFITQFGESEGSKKWIEHTNKTKNDKNAFVRKYGQEDGIKKFNTYIKNKKESKLGMYSIEWFKNKYGGEDGIKRFTERNERFTKDAYILKHGKAAFDKKNNNATNSRTLETYKLKYGVKEGNKLYKSIQKKKGNTNARMIEKYGELEGKKRYESYLTKLRISNSKVGYILNYGEEEGNKRWGAFIIKSKHTLDGYKMKYGNLDGTKRFSEYTMKRIKSLQYETYIEKYGKEQGNKIWYEILERRIPTNKYSKISKEFFDKLVSFNNFDITNCKYASEEVCILLDEEEMIKLSKFAIYPDFIYNNIIIEFNGDYWHTKGCEKDKKRMEVLTARGYDVYTIWESDYNKDKELSIIELSTLLKKG